MSPQRIPDGGWGWVVVACSLTINFICDGIGTSIGFINTKMAGELSGSRAGIASIGSLFISGPLLSGSISSTLVQRYGCGRMTVIGGLLCSIGFLVSSFSTSIIVMNLTLGLWSGLSEGLCYLSPVVCVSYWFDKRRALANSICFLGRGLGPFFFSPIIRLTIDNYGWRRTMMILAAAYLIPCVCGFLIRDPAWLLEQRNTRLKENAQSHLLKPEKEETPGSCSEMKVSNGKSCPDHLSVSEREEDKTPVIEELVPAFSLSIIGNSHFIVLYLAMVIIGATYIIPYFYITELMSECGQHELAGTIAISVYGLATICGLLVMGWIGDRPWMNVTWGHAVCLLISGLSILAMPSAPNLTYLIFTFFSFGFFIASNCSFVPNLLIELGGLERFGSAYGISSVCLGIGFLIGPPFSGWIFESTNSWSFVFYVAGGSMATGGLLIGCIPLTKSVQLCGSRGQTNGIDLDAETA